MAAPKIKYGIGNSASTTSSSSITDSATTLPLTSDTNFQAESGEGMVLIDEGQAAEEIAYSTGLSGSSLTIPVANRGLEGGSAQAHDSGASVKGILTVGMWNDLVDSMLNVLTQSSGAVDTTKVVTPTSLTATDTAKRIVSIVLLDDDTDNAVGDKTGNIYFTVPEELNGMDLINAHASNSTAGTTGTQDIQIYNLTQTTDMLSTKITVDSGETSSYTAATPPVIDTSNDDVSTGDQLRFDTDSVHSGTAAKGLTIILTFQTP